jgi:hypothetical protein
MKFYYAVIFLVLMSVVAVAQENDTNQTGNETDEGDPVFEAKNILERWYENYKETFASFSRATGVEPEAITAVLAIALIIVSFGQKSRKYLVFLMAIVIILYIIGMI